MRGHVEVLVCGEYTEVVQVVGGTTVISVCILELAEVVQSVDLFESYLGSKERYRMEEVIGRAHSHCSVPSGIASFGSCLVVVLGRRRGSRSRSRPPVPRVEAFHLWIQRFHVFRRILVRIASSANIPGNKTRRAHLRVPAHQDSMPQTSSKHNQPYSFPLPVHIGQLVLALLGINLILRGGRGGGRRDGGHSME